MTAISRICVTGASGRAGRVTVGELLAHGHDVIATDVRAPEQDIGVPVLRADLTDYGQAVEVLDGAEAVIHLANIPAPGIHPSVHTFTVNTAMNYNVFNAATRLGLRRVVWASSETTLGLPFDTAPRYAPVDEQHYPHPTTSYALSKVTAETLAEHLSAWSGTPFVALRFSNILGPAEYPRFPEYWPDPAVRKWNLWGYVGINSLTPRDR
jgi:nucleoside-diphosphate-sugar epimerase